MPFGKIKQKSNFNFSLSKYNEKGFAYYDKLGMSFQRQDSYATMKEIIEMCSIINYNIKIKIKLKNGITIIYDNTSL
jgi:hypothetical protein